MIIVTCKGCGQPTITIEAVPTPDGESTAAVAVTRTCTCPPDPRIEQTIEAAARLLGAARDD